MPSQTPIGTRRSAGGAGLVRRELNRPDASSSEGAVVFVRSGPGGAPAVPSCAELGADIEPEAVALEGLARHLEDCYDRLSPGAPVVLVLEGNRAPALDEVRSRLAAAGFVRPKTLLEPHATAVSALRGEALPPARRTAQLTVIVPAYNERSSFSSVMDQLVEKKIDGVDIEIIVVESNSTDGTREAALEYAGNERVRLVLQDRANGKGNAVRAGLAEATGDFVLIQDADLEYDMDDYERLLEPLLRYESAFVLGARRQAGHTWHIRQFGEGSIAAPVMNVGHIVFATLFNLVYGQRLRDPFTMYKVIRRDALFGLGFECNRFDFDWELVAKLVRAGYRPLELLVSYNARSFAEGKKISPVRDSLTWIKACFKYRFSRLYDW